MKKSSTKDIIVGSAVNAAITALFCLIGYAILGFTGVMKFSQTEN